MSSPRGPASNLSGASRSLPVGVLFGCALLAIAAATLLVEAEIVELTRRANQAIAEGDALRLDAVRTQPEHPTPGTAGGRTAAERTAAERAKLLERATRLANSSVRLRSDAESIRARRAPLIVGIVPALAMLLACFAPSMLRALRAWDPRRIAALGAGLSVWMLLLTSHGWLTPKGFDAYLPVILGAACFAAVLTPRGETAGKLSAAALGVWLLLWIPFDLRWYKDLWLGSPGLEYTCFSVLVSLIAILGFSVVGRLDVLGVRPPERKDLKPALILTVIVAVVLIPLGLGTGFLKVTVPQFDLGGGVLVFLSLALTVALPEELFFRGILDAGLQKHFRNRWASLAISSFLFGLMHWNNVGSLDERLLYVLLATLAGAAYGAAFRTSKGLAAPILLHTLLDLIWQLALGG